MVDRVEVASDPRDTLVRELAANWLRHGVVGLLLGGPGPDDEAASTPGTAAITVLVPRRRARVARQVVESMTWRFHVGSHGGWQMTSAALYTFDTGCYLKLCSRIPFGPLPSLSLRPLEDALWRDARVGEDGLLRPSPEALAVYLSAQTARPGPIYHRSDWEHFRRCAPLVRDWAAARQFARSAKVQGPLDRALGALQVGDQPSPSAMLDIGVGRVAWEVADLVRRRVRPRRLRTLIVGNIDLGVVPSRARFAGLELLSSPPVFPPMPASEPLVALAVEGIAGLRRPIHVDVGTGCGAVALAVKARRPDAVVHATELDRRAVRQARRNRRRLGLAVELHPGSILEPLPTSLEGRVDAITANLPYFAPTRYVPAGAVAREAIQGEGHDGLDLYRALLRQANRFVAPNARLIVQMFDWQWRTFAADLEAAAFSPGGAVRHGEFVVGWAHRVSRS